MMFVEQINNGAVWWRGGRGANTDHESPSYVADTLLTTSLFVLDGHCGTERYCVREGCLRGHSGGLCGDESSGVEESFHASTGALRVHGGESIPYTRCDLSIKNESSLSLFGLSRSIGKLLQDGTEKTLGSTAT